MSHVEVKTKHPRINANEQCSPRTPNDRPATPGNRRSTDLFLRLLVIAFSLVLWFWTQALIGSRPFPEGGIGDVLHRLTAPLNQYLHMHTTAANALLIISSAIIDALGIFLIARYIFGSTIRPFLALAIVLGLRQILQALVALPAPPGEIWHFPGFPSLLVTYGVTNDFFFSGHTAVAVLGAGELIRCGRRWLKGLAVLIALFEVTTVLILRAHYTIDVFAGVVTGLCAIRFAEYLAPAIDRVLVREGGTR